MFSSSGRRQRQRRKPAPTVAPNPLMATREKEQKRFYLFPGMGGKAYRRKRNLILQASIAVGLIVSGAFALAMYFIYHSPK